MYPPQLVHLLFNKMTTWLRTTTYESGAMTKPAVQEEKLKVVEAWKQSGMGLQKYAEKERETRRRYSYRDAISSPKKGCGNAVRQAIDEE